jgi:hypothetical protein
MADMLIARPLNGVQTRFNELCRLGGGIGGGPARGRVQEALAKAGKALNELGYGETEDHLAALPDANPWHVCFAIALGWGHLARLDLDFSRAAVRLMAHWNDGDLRIARKFCTERGPTPVEQSLRGGYMMFQKVVLPKALPKTIAQCSNAQQRWLGTVISKDRPPYIGSWNATAMFMVSLFANRGLADQLRERDVLLPPSGAVFNGLSILHRAGVLSRAPSGSALDDADFEGGALYENNALFEELIKGYAAWNMIDVHSGVYMLGTRLADSNQWYPM